MPRRVCAAYTVRPQPPGRLRPHKRRYCRYRRVTGPPVPVALQRCCQAGRDAGRQPCSTSHKLAWQAAGKGASGTNVACRIAASRAPLPSTSRTSTWL